MGCVGRWYSSYLSGLPSWVGRWSVQEQEIPGCRLWGWKWAEGTILTPWQPGWLRFLSRALGRVRSNQENGWSRGADQRNPVLDGLQGGSLRKFSNNRNSQPGRGGSLKIWNITYSVTAFQSKKETVAGQSVFPPTPALANFLKCLKISI